MPEIRRDAVVERWVVIAQERANRPDEFASGGVESSRESVASCPFCPGNEDQTPNAVLNWQVARSEPTNAAWQIRAFANAFPAVVIDLPSATATADAESGVRRAASLLRMSAGYGRHEVVVDSAAHGRSISELSERHVADLFAAYQARLNAMRGDARLTSGLVFKNVGHDAGASIAHAHTQIVGTERATPLLEAELVGARRHFEATGQCVYCEMLEAELQAEVRIVLATDEVVAFCPFASRFAYETWIVPRNHQSHFELDGYAEYDGAPRAINRADASVTVDARGTRASKTVAAVARIVRRVVSGLEKVLDRPAYNYVIHSAPFDLNECAYYHWHVELMPRTSMLAGFELGGGGFINAVPPERAAVELRTAVGDL